MAFFTCILILNNSIWYQISCELIPAIKYYYLRWPASQDFSVAAAGIEGELCVRMAEKLRIRQFNMKLFKIR